LGWQTIKDAAHILTYQAALHEVSLVIGIARGGLIPATMLSHNLNVPMVNISATSYMGRVKMETVKLDINENVLRAALKAGSKALIVDDIIDSGDTFRELHSTFPDAKYASLVTKRHTTAFHYIRVPKEVWVKFPWEYM
jgi:xanthine phosphoribosyltransferase